MEQVMTGLPEKIQKHLQGILSSTDLPQNDESLNVLAQNWLGKKELFESMIRSISMDEADHLGLDDKRAMLVLTYSGSLIGIGPNRGEGRWMEYASIALRKDVPGIVTVEATNLQEPVSVDAGAKFTQGSVKSTSAIFMIAVCAQDVDLAEQEKRVKEAMIFLTNAFVKLNQKSFAADGEAPEQFNMKAMIKFLSAKNNLTQKQVKALVTDFLTLAETGILLGERVPLGKIGNMSLKLRPPRKPRVMKNRFTGQEMTIPAMPERWAPKISFSKRLKERAAEMKTGE
ncbi:MAG: HU family DNA-binding protein [Spirochaetales bacterium]|nr:HU family DNA-binding protein [Spirochaetales bacterium]